MMSADSTSSNDNKVHNESCGRMDNLNDQFDDVQVNKHHNTRSLINVLMHPQAASKIADRTLPWECSEFADQIKQNNIVDPSKYDINNIGRHRVISTGVINRQAVANTFKPFVPKIFQPNLKLFFNVNKRVIPEQNKYSDTYNFNRSLLVQDSMNCSAYEYNVRDDIEMILKQ